ncbi:TAP-like protein-domain-containing protein [Astrocystis sublimbata]|nr:TAP-like protein-domain-containing protein [Astrocystis sublimbata]
MAQLTRLFIAGVAAAGIARGATLDASDAVSKWVKESNQSIKWGPCPDRFRSSSLTCATYRVPIDWKSSQTWGNETIELGMVRREAEDQERRIGYLFVNPGGPGYQASNTVSSRGDKLDPEIRARFDIIGLDSRGVGISTPITCDPEVYNRRVKYMPKTEDEWQALLKYNKDLYDNCLEKTGPLIGFVDTISAVKDYEAVRLAFGEKASFLGFSYGTQLFSQYAELFPDSFRAMILDANLQHSQSEASNIIIDTTAYGATFKQFFDWCATTDECALRGKDVAAVFERIRDKAAAAPLSAPGCDDVLCRTDVTEEDIIITAQYYLAAEKDWPTLAKAIADTDKGDATIWSQFWNLIAIDDLYTDTFLYAGVAIGCQDWDHASMSLADMVQKDRIGELVNPLTRGACQSWKLQSQCIGWPVPLTNPPAPNTYSGDVEILMVNALYDGTTSYAWAVGLQREINNAVLLTRNGSGHSSYFLDGETTELMNAYLLNLTLPKPDTITNS